MIHATLNQNIIGHGQVGSNIKQSRLASDVERIITLIQSVNTARERVSHQTTTLGYFSDAPTTNKNTEPSPIWPNLQNMLSELERSIDGLHGALNLFD